MGKKIMSLASTHKQMGLGTLVFAGCRTRAACSRYQARWRQPWLNQSVLMGIAVMGWVTENACMPLRERWAADESMAGVVGLISDWEA